MGSPAGRRVYRSRQSRPVPAAPRGHKWFSPPPSWCVINTMVRLRRWLISASRASTEAVVLGDPALVASSHSNTSGRAASARAMPTRCFCPPESCDGKAAAFFAEIHQLQQFAHPGLASGPRHSGNLQAAPRCCPATVRACSRIEVLENHPGAQAIIRSAALFNWVISCPFTAECGSRWAAPVN